MTHSQFIQTHPVVLVILDGWGIRDAKEHNAIALAHTPCYDSLLSQYPHTQLHASGNEVGLPHYQFGNSEVGHMTIGAGRILFQDLVKINNDIEKKTIEQNSAFQEVFSFVKEHRSTLHIIGLLSNGGVHSHEDHFISLIDIARNNNVSSIALHPFLDGRDSSPQSGIESLKKIEHICSLYPEIQIKSVCGRYFSMDRDKNMDRTEKAVNAIVYGKAERMYTKKDIPSEIVQSMYAEGMYDEYIEPFVLGVSADTSTHINENDGIIMTNFRKDRMRQLSHFLEDYSEDKNIRMVTMTSYTEDSKAAVAYPKEHITHTLGEVLSAHGYKQTRIAETEKYAHVTYFFNGGSDRLFQDQENVLIPSRRDIQTHDKAPEMRAKEITDEAIKRLKTSDFILINYANADMVGHSANEQAIISAVECIDKQLTRLTEAILSLDGYLIITADHGNAEETIDSHTGLPRTSHTTNDVPFLFIHSSQRPHLRRNGGLQDIAPTILDVFQIEKPFTMTGESLIDKKDL